ncbi:Asp-tRNA(Asn)/Glu-tRNA(Gln) amidotransferase subunit GatA [Candidatus Pacearchaeota archaeon]|nr:Asp-tRNA(Asn)/Glu-tRNA(Gln) amidotransferase subunit GatA [Candidatus Pacearchaeota archaeon]
MIKEKLKLIQSGKLSCEENISSFINKIKKEDGKINSILHINEKAIGQAKLVDKKIKSGNAGKLAGLGFIVKSNINVMGLICNCASKTLENYKSTYNATVISKLLAKDAIVLGMANMDEFACGASGETSAFGVCKNPRDLNRIPGGSSSGSCSSVAAEFCDFSLGSDTGGSIRNPSSHCGVVGYKPSYGVVSRYGLIDLSMSLDQIGPIGSCVNDCKIIFDIIKGKDVRDSISREFKSEKKDLKKIKIGIPKISADKKIWDLVLKRVDLVCKKNGWKKEEVSINHIDLGIQTYYPIVYVEFYSGTRRFDGRKYGHIIEESCGEEVLRRILGGEIISQEEFSGTYYRRALKAKKLIEKEFNEAFSKFDILIMPTVPRLPHKFGEKVSIEDMYNYDTLTVLANLAEICGISIPCGEIDGIPVGMQVLGKKGGDDFLLDVCGKIE